MSRQAISRCTVVIESLFPDPLWILPGPHPNRYWVASAIACKEKQHQCDKIFVSSQGIDQMDWWIDHIAADIWLILQNIADCARWTAYKLSKFLVRVTIFFTPLNHLASQIFGEGGSWQEGWNLIRLAKFGKICHDIWPGQTVWKNTSVQSYMQSAVDTWCSNISSVLRRVLHHAPYWPSWAAQRSCHASGYLP